MKNANWFFVACHLSNLLLILGRLMAGDQVRGDRAVRWPSALANSRSDGQESSCAPIMRYSIVRKMNYSELLVHGLFGIHDSILPVMLKAPATSKLETTACTKSC